MADAPKRFVSPRELAAELGVSTATFYAHLRKRLPCVTVGRRVCFELEPCLAILREPPKMQPAAPPPAVYVPPPGNEERLREIRERDPKLARLLDKLGGRTPEPPAKRRSDSDPKWAKRLERLRSAGTPPQTQQQVHDEREAKWKHRLDSW